MIRRAIPAALALALLAAPAWADDTPAPFDAVTMATGTLTITPGGNEGVIAHVLASAPCTGSNFLIQITGAGFAAGTNGVGNTAIPDSSVPVETDLNDTFLNLHGGSSPSGTARLRLVCIGTADDFIGNVDFTPTAASTFTWAATPPGCNPVTTTDCGGLPTPPPSPRPGTEAYRLVMPGLCENSGESCGSLTLTVPVGAVGNFIIGAQRFIDGHMLVQFTATLVPVTVNDSRVGGSAWSVSGQMSPFTRTGGGSMSAVNAGWEPAVIAAGAGAVVGNPVTPGWPSGGSGLSVPRVLASASVGHGGNTSVGATLGGRLVVWAPLTTGAGEYASTLTVTLIG